MAHQDFFSGPQHVCILCEVQVVVREGEEADGKQNWERGETQERSWRSEGE